MLVGRTEGEVCVGPLDVFLIGVGLSMDAFAVTISNSMSMPHLSGARRLAFPIAFGAFQFLMPLVGFFAGSLFARQIEAVAGPFALVVLGILGANMIREGIGDMRSGEAGEKHSFSVGLVLVQAVATSIDALAVGVSFAGYAGFPIVGASALIGVTTCVLCLIALAAGRRLGLRFGPRAQVVGGIILIIIGIKALIG